MKKGRRLLAFLLCAVLLIGVLPLCGGRQARSATDDSLLQHAHWFEITAEQTTQKYSGGEKFIVLFYRAGNAHCRDIATNVVTPWMDQYACDVYGVNVDTAGGIPSWVWSALGVENVILPLTVFAENKTVTGFQGATDATIDALNETFYAFMGVTPPAVPSALYTYEVRYHQTEARTLLNRINALRTGKDAWCWNETDTEKEYFTDLQPLTYDYELEQAAMQRAAELVADYDHYRPNGKRGFSAYFYETAGENIAAGFLYADEVEEAWEEADNPYRGQGHRRMILSPFFTAVGIACAEYNGRKYWVQEFRCPLSAALETPPNDGDASVTVEILDALVKSSTLLLSDSSLVLTRGETAALPTVTQRVEMNPYPSETLLCKMDCSWVSSDDTIARVSDGSLIAVAPGSASLNGTCASGETVTVQVEVTAFDAGYIVAFDANGGSVSPANAAVLQGESVTLPVPEKTVTITYNTNGSNDVLAVQDVELTCKGWATAADATVPEAACGVSYTPTEDTTLYAVWDLPAAFEIGSSVPERAGYTFLGWTTQADTTAAQYQPGMTGTLSDDTVFFAAWKLTDCAFDYEIADGRATITGYNGTPDGALELPAEIDGYPVVAIGENAFSGCTGLARVTVPDGVAQIGAGAFAGCTGLARITLPESVTEIAPQAFDGCSALQTVYYTGTQDSWSALTVGEGNDALTSAALRFGTPVYALTYDANGGSVSPSGARVTEGEQVVLPTPTRTLQLIYQPNGGSNAPAAQRADLTCKGWATAADATTPAAACGASYMPTEDTTLYAVWETPVSVRLSTAAPTRPGFTFRGWAASSAATAAQYQPGDAFALTANSTLYAVWTQNPTVDTVLYDANGGSGAPERQTSTDGTITLSTQIPTRSGYVFLGWAMTADAVQAEFRPGARCTVSGTITLFAVWAAVSQQPTVNIKNYVATRSVAYGAQVRLTAVTENAPADASVHWFLNGADVFTGDVLTVTVKSDAEIRLRLIGSDGAVLAESKTETITTNSGFFAKLVFFFKNLFGIREVIEQRAADRG
ncbi:MAG: InlB B-repeat-containing protein [Clostridia bacterium]|nr:InlB B-repeat-containing protein [Clostridia bacterium]